MIIIGLLLLALILLATCLTLLFKQHNASWQHELDKQLELIRQQLNQSHQQSDQWQHYLTQQSQHQHAFRERFDAHQASSIKHQQESLSLAMDDVRKQITATLSSHTEQVNKQLDKLSHETQKKLHDISQEVDKQLAHGFEKTTATFTDIVKRLAIIDEAQKKITELSSNVVSLQEILSDKRSRGAFGEVQLNALIDNMLPTQNYAFQHTLSNGKRADCILFLPAPTGAVVIDAKFPLEGYQNFQNSPHTAPERNALEQQFKQDIKKHIQDIADKYIIEQETADGAMMFIPAEAIFAEIHAHHPDLVELAQRKKIWLVSPTTMMAVINTARAVLKDEATRKQVHLIQEHLVALSRDFERFQKRMDNLAKHINQAQEDVSLVHKSSQKISSRFHKIEQVELTTLDGASHAAPLCEDTSSA